MGRCNNNVNRFDLTQWADWANNCAWLILGCCGAVLCMIAIPFLLYMFSNFISLPSVTTTPTIPSAPVNIIGREFIREEPWDEDDWDEDLNRIIIHNTVAPNSEIDERIDDFIESDRGFSNRGQTRVVRMGPARRKTRSRQRAMKVRVH